jgi:large subunit ribosomal protein L15
VNLGEIDKRFEDGGIVTEASLVKAGLVKGPRPVKVLGGGDVTRKLVVKIAAVSASAREKIEKAGGTVTAKAADKAEMPDAGVSNE